VEIYSSRNYAQGRLESYAVVDLLPLLALYAKNLTPPMLSYFQQ
jgi:hypothetical protein